VIVPVNRSTREPAVMPVTSPVPVSNLVDSATPAPTINDVDISSQPKEPLPSKQLEISGMIDIIPPFALGKIPQHFKITVNESESRALSGKGSIDGVATYSVTGRRYENSIKLVLQSENRPDRDEVLTLIGEKNGPSNYSGSYQSSKSPDPGFWKGNFTVR